MEGPEGAPFFEVTAASSHLQEAARLLTILRQDSARKLIVFDVNDWNDQCDETDIVLRDDCIIVEF